MQDSNRDPERDKKLDRRPWQGLLLMLIVTLVLVCSATGVMLVFSRVIRDAGPTRTPWTIAGAILLLGLLLIIGVGGLVLSLFIMRWSMEKQKQNFAEGTRVLQRTLPQLVSERETKAAQDLFSGKSFVKLLLLFPVYAIAVGVLVWAIRSNIPRFWPDAPEWVSDVILWALILGSALIVRQTVAKRREKQGDDEAPSLKTSLLRIMGILFFLAFCTLPLFGLFSLLDQIHTLVMVPLMLILFPLGFGLLSLTYLLVPLLWTLAALKRADYKGAIRRSRWMEQVHAFRGAFLNLHGFALFLAGRYEEAKQLLQDSIQATRRELAAGGADGLDNIGCVLTAQGQYDEAIKMFEGAIAISPKHVSAYNDLAQVYLLRGTEPQRALELTERALENYQASFWYRWLERFNFGSIWANRAWALALLGRHSEAAQALEQAFAGTDCGFLPEFAGVHFRAGQTELLRGDRAKAIEHWEQARQLDPQGHYGRLAAQVLRNPGG